MTNQSPGGFIEPAGDSALRLPIEAGSWVVDAEASKNATASTLKDLNQGRPKK